MLKAARVGSEKTLWRLGLYRLRDGSGRYKKKGRHESLAPASQRIMLTNVGFGLKQSLSNHCHDP